jgi:hypothetical protein
MSAARTLRRGGPIATTTRSTSRAPGPAARVRGFLTHGGMSVKEVEAMAIGLRDITTRTWPAARCAEVLRQPAADTTSCGDPGGLAATSTPGSSCRTSPARYRWALSAAYLAWDPDDGAGTISDRINTGRRCGRRGADPDRRAAPRLHDSTRARWTGGLALQARNSSRTKFTDEPPVLRFFFGKLAGWTAGARRATPTRRAGRVLVATRLRATLAGAGSHQVALRARGGGYSRHGRAGVHDKTEGARPAGRGPVLAAIPLTRHFRTPLAFGAGVSY